ncbi:MAG: patatin-like phospholipase family protein [Ignavibacteriaceae bacterium]|nr:patatin-like phospholipase family protein [Ignavibacteriaceae bacterium]
MANKKRDTALVLGTGGARGLAHIGVIQALEENNIPIDIITGTSIGALVGGIYAAGVKVSRMESIVSDVNKIMVAKILMPKLFAPGFIDNKRILDFIKDLVGNVKIENLKIPFAAVATDLITGEEVIFNHGLLSDALMASIAIPTIFQPVMNGGRILIDGGLSNPLPVSVALKMNAQTIIAVNVSPNPQRLTRKIKSKKNDEANSLIKKLPAMFLNFLNDEKLLPVNKKLLNGKNTQTDFQTYSPSMMNVFLQSISISTNNLMLQHLRYAKPDILIAPKIESYDLLEFFKGAEIIKRGYDETIKSLGAIELSVNRTGQQ